MRNRQPNVSSQVPFVTYLYLNIDILSWLSHGYSLNFITDSWYCRKFQRCGNAESKFKYLYSRSRLLEPRIIDTIGLFNQISSQRVSNKRLVLYTINSFKVLNTLVNPGLKFTDNRSDSHTRQWKRIFREWFPCTCNRV